MRDFSSYQSKIQAFQTQTRGQLLKKGPTEVSLTVVSIVQPGNSSSLWVRQTYRDINVQIPCRRYTHFLFRFEPETSSTQKKAISLYLGFRKGFYLALTRKITSILYLYYIAKSGCYAQFKVGVNLRTLQITHNTLAKNAEIHSIETLAFSSGCVKRLHLAKTDLLERQALVLTSV